MDLASIIAAADRAGVTYADARQVASREQSLRWVDGELEAVSQSESDGIALRVLAGGTWGFASSQDFTESASEFVDRAIQLANGVTTTSPARVADAPVLTGGEIWHPKIDPENIAVEEKVELLRDLEKTVRVHPEMHSVTAAYRDGSTITTYQDTQGRDLQWGLTRTVAQCHFTVKRGDRLEASSARVGATKGWEIMQEQDPIQLAEDAAKRAVAALDAKTPKGGKQTVVTDPSLTGVFAHEAVGHASEADLVRAGESCFRGRMGEQLGPENITIRDDSSRRGAFGAYPYDDEGMPAQNRVLIQNGVLAGFLADRESAAALGIPATGAARAQDVQSRPLVRMSVTMVDGGDLSHDEVFEGIKEGIYCCGSRGGQVDTSRGTYMFNAQDAFMIRDGQIAEPVRGVSLTGDVLSTLHNIDGVGREVKLGEPGFCGKGQWVPVADGGPHLRINDCLVGGA